MKIIAIGGSPRKKGNTNYLIDHAFSEAEKYGIETEKIILSQHTINGCLAHDNCGSFDSCLQKDDAAWILKKFYQADGLILASPVYYYNVSAQFKTFIDRNYFHWNHGEEKCRARAIGMIVIANSDGIEEAVHMFDRFTEDIFQYAPDRIYKVTGYASEAGEVKNNQKLLDETRTMGRLLAESLKQ